MSSSARISRSPSRFTYFFLFAILALFLITIASPVLAQEEELPVDPSLPEEPAPEEPAPEEPAPEEPAPEEPAPEEPVPTGENPPVEVPTGVPTAINPVPSATVPAPTSSPTPFIPDPIFSTSDSCEACRPQFFAIRNCTTRIPTGVNLTMIQQVLPFYQCICPNGGSQVDALQQCSICLRSTAQQSALNLIFYNVTNQDVKAMKQVCTETADGTKVPSGAAGFLSFMPSATFTFASVAVLLLLMPFGGL
ncbi:hypothetical protein BX616_004659 [Lobosporangium transversale]|uniref:Uncharacterized protein n=1 Tax=Lobosporangium transversale TaxID=64571 RepID=A0A1Y2GSD2_9FUNG|nr:hypothetical protein BCR41DRAFT_350922 [Lobosporangium transversale]KAF9916090.1 hypothetical protein BX616_004659 [Lobosporangium transversale]ORZ21026.1 hypothetical protein BCR41DRAFT_350922 [Lobosporangium transversale]|eukprot:XP_021882935.1 hypothetical protein BCR41DRAFT_350922 [Lobosporangium transversale]